MLDKVLNNELLAQVAARIARGRTLTLSGVWGSSVVLAAAALGRIARAPVLLVTAQLDEADQAADDFEVFTGRCAQIFPAWDSDIRTGEHITDEVAGERIRLCSLLLKAQSAGAPRATSCTPYESQAPRATSCTPYESQTPRATSCTPYESQAPGATNGTPCDSGQQQDEHADFIIAPVMALLQPVPSPEALEQNRLTLKRGQEFDLEELVSWLVDAGFDSVEQVDQQGEFARRGGILDVFPAGTTQAVRVEFFGESVESIRRIDLDTQRSTQEVDSYDITAIVAARPGEAQSRSLLDYLPPETILCIHQPQEVMELATELHRRLTSKVGFGLRLQHDDADGQALAEAAPATQRAGVLNPEDLFIKLKDFSLVELTTFAGGEDRGAVNMGVRSLQKLSLNTHDALTELTELADVANVLIFCENPAEQSRFEELLKKSYPSLAKRATLHTGHVHGGFHWPQLKLVAVGHHEIFHRYSQVRRIRRVRAGRPIESLLDLAAGDYVVHVSHGIARFDGLKTLSRDGKDEEYLALRFADNAILHVPSSSINLVQRYVGARGKRPSLSKLGSATWAKQKSKVAAAVTDMAAQLLEIQALRQSASGSAYAQESDWQRQFTQEFIYSETEDQLLSMKQIDNDMALPRPMDRLLCGDVGYGKTELAMRAAFKIVESGRQVAVLVPTTVLAQQHWRTFTERFADYPFTIEHISRFRTPSEQANVLARLAAGQVDILIGTHRLLSKDVKFADLGLVVIDEEQRFGVEHKERLKNLRASVEVLTMTATPIPRTLHMALLGLRDISSLATPPLDRRAIQTEVRPYDEELIQAAIYRELNRQGQVFLVHNRVKDIEHLANRVRELVGDARVAVGHGQMPHAQLEDVMMRLISGQIDVLVCTTIIESGLDIPTANTMIIHDADRFGLAELHQLRGRVGRYKHRAYCYLLLPERRTLTPIASKRLKAIEDFSDLGAGFAIAMRDLEIRGAGNILGPEQSGHIAAVGYELYCQLLEHAVRQAKGEPAPSRHDVHVELGIESFLPRTFVPSERQRMEVYRRIAGCGAVADVNQLETDLADAYGPVPAGVQVLLDLAEVRIRAGQLGVQSIILMEPDIIFTFRDFKPAQKLFEGAHGSVRLPDERTVHWRPPKAYLQMPTLLRVLLNRLRHAQEAV